MSSHPDSQYTHNQKLTNEHVTLLQNTMFKLIENPILVDHLTVNEVLNLSTFSRKMPYHLPFPFLSRNDGRMGHPIWRTYYDRTTQHCLPLYHKFQELGSKYNLKQFIQCVRER